jgi:hypothetical protein
MDPSTDRNPPEDDLNAADRVVGRRLCSDVEAAARGFGSPECAQRRRVLRETLIAFEQSSPPDRYLRLASENLGRWRNECESTEPGPKIGAVKGDWGEVTLSLTRKYGTSFAVLNMANAYVPGGGYVEGAIAQEENMYRRTDCHFYVGADYYDQDQDRYRPEMTRLLSARDGRVYMDTGKPRVCIRGPEDRQAKDLGYKWLSHDDVFPFYELRAAAQDLRDGSSFDAPEARRRIRAQLDTLNANGIRHAVLGAFGCGAFRNPSEQVAQLYREEIAAQHGNFDVIAFAIRSAGYGRDNLGPFTKVFGAA